MRPNIPLLSWRTLWECCIWIIIVQLSLFSGSVQPWTTDISPKILIKYGKCGRCYIRSIIARKSAYNFIRFVEADESMLRFMDLKYIRIK